MVSCMYVPGRLVGVRRLRKVFWSCDACASRALSSFDFLLPPKRVCLIEPNVDRSML